MPDQNDTVEGFAEDATLSLAAKGLYAVLAEWPSEGRGPSMDAASQRTRSGITAVRSAMRELEAAGYVTRSQRRLPSGIFTTTYLVHEHPVDR